MRYLFLAILMSLLCISVNVLASPDHPNLKNLSRYIELKSGDSKKMYVIFNHSSHKNVACKNCHHEGLPGNRYASCTNKDCHAITAASSRDVLSVYMAYHAPGTQRSCFGCHKPLAGKYQGFKGCGPCHKSFRDTITAQK